MSAEINEELWFPQLFPTAYDNLREFLNDGFIYELSNMTTETAQVPAAMGANTIFLSWLVCFSLIGCALLGRMSLSNATSKGGVEQYYADSKLSPRNLFEIFVGSLGSMAASVLGKKDAHKFFWIIGGLFLYILFSNLLGILPGGSSPSMDISNNFAMATFVLVLFTAVGFMRQGIHFITHMAGPVWYLYWLVLPIELFSTFIVRPASLSLRLGGNMNGDHTVLAVSYQGLDYVLPSLALGLGTFVSVVQAFVFTLLTIIYIVLSVGDEDHH